MSSLRQRVAAGSSISPERSGTRDRWAWGHAVSLTAVLGIVIGAFYLSVYPIRGIVVPIGWDTPRYVWRTTLVQEFGVAGMATGAPPGTAADPQRPGFPVLASGVSSVTGAGLFPVAAVLPAVAAVAIGLAGGTLVSTLRGRRRLQEVAIGALVVGMSPFVARLAGPEAYQDNLFAASVLLVAIIAVVLGISDRRALVPAALLLGAGGVIHWTFLAFALAVLGLTAVVHLPQSVQEIRAGKTLWNTVAGRVAVAAAGGAAVAAVTIFGVIGAWTRPPALALEELQRKLQRDATRYAFPFVLPVAALGAASLGLSARDGRRHLGARRSAFALILLLAWSVVVLAGYLALRAFGLAVPGHRFLAFALAVPLLAVLGILWVAGLAERRHRGVAAAILAAGVLSTVVLAASHWFDTSVSINHDKIDQAATVDRYLDAAGVQPGRPVVLLLRAADGIDAALMAHQARAGLPATRLDEVYFYVGEPENYLAGEPTTGSDPEVAATSRRYLATLEPAYARRPIAMLLEAYHPEAFAEWTGAHLARVVAPGVAVVRGPAPRSIVDPEEDALGEVSPMRLAGLAVAAGFIVWGVGIGWSVMLFRRWLRPLELSAVAPAVGIATVVLGGVVLDRLGVRLVGIGGVAAVMFLASAGWLAALIGARRARAPAEA